MSDTVGELKIALQFDNGKFKASQKEVEKESESFGKRLVSGAKSVGKKMAIGVAGAMGTAVAATIAASKKAFELYGEYEQLAGGVETLFGNAAETVLKNADIAYKTAQISANNYMSTITSFSASLLQSLGGDTKKAAEVADRAIIDMADNSNKMGTSMESIQNAYQGFAKANFSMLDNLKLGYGGTRSEMERLIDDASKMTDIQKELNVNVKKGDMSFANIANAISVVQKKMGIAGTSAKEAGETVQGSINMMKASWDNFLTALGNPKADVGKAADNLIKSIGTVINNALPVLMRILDKIIEYLPQLTQKIIEKLPELITKLVPKLVQAMVKISIELIKNLPQILASIFQALVMGITTLIAELAQGFGELFAPLGEALGTFFGGLWEGIVNGAKAAWEGITGAFANLAKFFGTIFSNAWAAVKAVFSTGGKIFMGIVDGILNAFKAIVNTIIRGINFVVAIPFNGINGFLNILKGINILGIKPFDWISNIGVPQIPLLAQGGYASGATGAIIGEEGKEAVLPLERNTDNWSGLLANALANEFESSDRGLGSGITIENQNFNIDSRLDAENIGQIMMQSIRRQAR